MIRTANRYRVGATVQPGEVARLPDQPTRRRDGDILPSLGVAAVLLLAKVLELYATNAI